MPNPPPPPQCKAWAPWLSSQKSGVAMVSSPLEILQIPTYQGPKFCRRRTNVQQLTCKLDLPFSFYYLFFSFVLLELKPFVLKGKVLGEKL